MSKEGVARELAARFRDGEAVGVGTGSTVDLALKFLGERMQKERLSVQVVPTSHQSAWRCQEIGLQVLYPGYRATLAWGFDGADEVDPDSRLIKGRGGAMLQEKILAARCKEFIVIVDDSKLVPTLGSKFAVPIEVIPEAISIVMQELPKLGATEMVVREGSGKHGPVITEAGNIIIDARFTSIGADYEDRLKGILGVVETGLFFGYSTEVWIAGASGVTKRKTGRRRNLL
jgi:ribose 5-phosphate isomerase A